MATDQPSAEKILHFQYWPDPQLMVAVVPCPRCCGRGYHWGFGWNGADPDWCLDCGGGQHEFRSLLTPLET